MNRDEVQKKGYIHFVRINLCVKKNFFEKCQRKSLRYAQNIVKRTYKEKKKSPTYFHEWSTFAFQENQTVDGSTTLKMKDGYKAKKFLSYCGETYFVLVAV